MERLALCRDGPRPDTLLFWTDEAVFRPASAGYAGLKYKFF